MPIEITRDGDHVILAQLIVVMDDLSREHNSFSSYLCLMQMFRLRNVYFIIEICIKLPYNGMSISLWSGCGHFTTFSHQQIWTMITSLNPGKSSDLTGLSRSNAQ